MKTLLAVVAAALLLGACAQGGGASGSGPGTGSITMYGTIDEGVTVRK
jgi:ABC-type glycerol-3-phosphate transport system substrate-binding protein